MIRLNVTEKWKVYWGNQPLFVGSGHRSLLWSDNGVAAMNLRMTYRFSKKWDLQFVRARGLNLLRRPIAVNGEAYYEPKSLSFSTLYFHPSEKWSIGLFEGGVWNRGDSLQSTPISPVYFIPLPGSALLQEQLNKKAYSLIGLDLNWTGNKIVVYGQAALNFATKNSAVYQAGTRLHLFKNRLSFIQLEYNHADKNAYQSSDPRIHYANYNLPIAHPAGNQFDEVIIRLNWEMNHWFVSAQSSIYVNQSDNYKSLLPIYQLDVNSNQQVYNQLVEAGYRFNRSYGFEIFGNFRYRFVDRNGPNSETTLFNVGIRTAINNHYTDF